MGAFLLMEAAGIGGALLDVVMLPGLLAAGVGFLIFVGLDNLTGFGTFTLAVPNLPPSARLPAQSSCGRLPSGWPQPCLAPSSAAWPWPSSLSSSAEWCC